MNCIDLFCGCGGMSLGFELAGFRILCAIDHWEPALSVYRANFSHPAIRADISQQEAICHLIRSQSPFPDLIMGGPPCQDFSSAGKRDVTLGRADLTYHFASIVCSIKPNWFVMENVERIKKSRILSDIIENFIATGYGLTAVLLDASLCGVPQLRTRFFLIGHLNDQHNQLLEIYRQSLSRNRMTVRDYLGNTLGISHYYRHPRNYSRRGIFSIDEPSPTVRGVNRPIPGGYKGNSCDPPGVDIKQLRPLTTTERSYLQTFPKSFKFFGTKTNVEQMIGNAVPVNLARFVAAGIRHYMCRGPRKEATLFDSIDATTSPVPPLLIPSSPLRRTPAHSRE